ncbi:hypothetical protein ABPG72_007147 [Tetrahymena utriculariae]
MQEGRIEIKTRPQKSGWLEQQVNSVFNIWQTKYFVLDGTELLVFDDDQRVQPIASVNLNRCIVDGVWEQNELFVITIRSLVQDMEEQFIQLGSVSMQEISEWMETLKSAIILLEYETLFKQLEMEEQVDKCIQNSDDSISDIDSDDFQEHPANGLDYEKQIGLGDTLQGKQNELQLIQQDFEKKLLENKNAWTLFQVESNFRVYRQVNSKQNQVCYKMQGYLENIDFYCISSIFSDPLNDHFWDFYLQEKELFLKVKENYQIYKTREQFYSNKKIFKFENVYREISWFDTNQKNKIFYQFRQTIQDNCENKKQTEAIQLKTLQQIIKIEYVKKGFIQFCVYLAVPYNHLQKYPIFETYLMERFVNFSVFKFEFNEILEKVLQRQKRINGNQLDFKKPIYQPIKSYQVLDRNDYDSFSQINSVRSLTKLPLNLQYDDPSWDEETHLRIKKLNEQQKNIFNSFKQKNISLKLTDNEYIQFLVARKFNQENAQEMLENWKQWKAQTNFDNLTIDDFPHLHRLKAYRYIGKDAKGRPIGFGVSRNIFPEQLPCDYDEYCLYYMVYLKHMRKLATGHVDQIVMINDVGGLISSNVDLSLTRRQLKLVLDFFPEGVYKLIAVNVDLYCRILWKAIKPFLEKSTQDKIVIVGSDQEEIHSTLLQYIDDDLIPAIYGGKNQAFSSF